jgi:phosphoglycerate dehydrogenase-like enzyme
VTEGGTVAVHGGRFGDVVVGGMQALLPDVRVVPAGSADAAGADVLAALADERAAIDQVLHPGIRWVHVLAAGVDGFPLEAAGQRVVTCSRGASAPAIAEFVLAAMLAVEKRLPGAWISEPPAAWNVADLGGLEGRRLALVGLGAIGSAVARRALAFDMRVAGIRRRAGLGGPEGVEYRASLHDLVADADHVVVAAPATRQTTRMFDAAAFAATKPGAHFVNVARGALVDQTALLDALDGGHLSTATLDVVEPEPLPAGHAFYSHPNIRLSPHISWSSPMTARRTFELFGENLDRFRRDQPLVGVVDPEAGY